MKAKIYEGRIYSVIKEKDGNFCVETMDGCIRMMQNSKRQWKPREKSLSALQIKRKFITYMKLAQKL